MRVACVLLLMLFEILSLSAQPWTPELVWDRSGLQDSSGYGYQVLPLGDQNSDGYADWAVWAYGYGTDPSYLEFFHGGTPPSTQPYLTFRDDPQGIFLIWSVGELGDLNGDGHVDWHVDRRYSANPSQKVVTIYFGGHGADTTAGLSFSTEQTTSVRPIGDYNGDGFDDILLYYFQNYGMVFYGGSSMDTIPDWARHTPVGVGLETRSVGYGHLNSDNYSDWTSNSYGTLSATYVFLGSSQPDTLPAYTWSNFFFGPTGVVKDMNGDGHDEIVYRSTWSARIVFGADSLDQTHGITVNFPCNTPDGVASAGDVNRDGYQDLLLWESNCSNSEYGVLSLYLGHAVPDTEPVLTVYGAGPPFNFLGIADATGLGDVNGDGAGDFAVGSYTTNIDVGYRGRAVILGGDTTLPAQQPRPQFPEQPSVSVYPNPSNGWPTLELSPEWFGKGKVTIAVYNLLGQCLSRREVGGQSQSKQLISLSENRTLQAASGVYLLRVSAQGRARLAKFVVLK